MTGYRLPIFLVVVVAIGRAVDRVVDVVDLVVVRIDVDDDGVVVVVLNVEDDDDEVEVVVGKVNGVDDDVDCVVVVVVTIGSGVVTTGKKKFILVV